MVLARLFLRRRLVHKNDVPCDDTESKQLMVIALYITFRFYIHTLS